VLAGRLEDVTLRRLLTHRSGLMTETPLPTWDTDEFPSRDEVLAALPQTEVVIPQDSAFKYSNLAFGLLGEVIARVSGQAYFDYVHEHILGPLGMDSSVYELTDELRPRMAIGYSPDLFRDELDPAAYVLLGGVAACGQLHSTPADLARWIALQFRVDAVDDTPEPVLSPRTLEEFHRPQYTEPDWSAAQCLGWRSLRVGERVYHGHGGGIFGFSSHVLFSKPHRLGVICLANLWPYPHIQSVAVGILERLSGNPDPPPLAPSGTPALASGVSCPREPGDDRRSAFAGLYVANPGVPVHVEFRDGELRLAPSPLWPYQLHTPGVLEPTDDPLVFRVRGGRGSGEAAVFQAGKDGLPSQFTLGGFAYHKVME